MQTFLPYPNFIRSARVLDNKRLGKQRVECVQILKALAGESKGWVNHPATKMWRGYDMALGAYKDACIYEWSCRGFRNTIPLSIPAGPYELPPWFGDVVFHRSHQSNLLRKDREHYGSYFPDVPDNLPYVWPVL